MQLARYKCIVLLCNAVGVSKLYIKSGRSEKIEVRGQQVIYFFAVFSRYFAIICIRLFIFSHVVPVPFMSRKIPKRNTELSELVKTLPEYKPLVKSKMDLNHRPLYLRSHLGKQHFVASIPHKKNEINTETLQEPENRRMIKENDSPKKLKILRKIVKKVISPVPNEEVEKE